MAPDLPTDPIALFTGWYGQATEHELNDPNAMALATVAADGTPSVRIVLLKGFDAKGFVFYTNLNSAKGQALAAHPHAELNFHWKSLGRQVRVAGAVAPVTPAEADAYFASRPRDSQIGAWASQQSAPLVNRQALLDVVAATNRRFANAAVPRPPHWSGFRVRPDQIEFWEADPFRLHQRWRYMRAGDDWTVTWLNP